MIIIIILFQDAGCLWLQNSGHGPPSGMMCRPSFVLYKTWGVCARILSGKQNRAASAAWSADCLYLISLSPHSPSGPSHAGSSALRWEREFYFSLYHMTEYFTNVMLLLHEYNFYVSFYRMTKYFTNIILLLNEYYLCAAFHYGVHRDQRVRDGNGILRWDFGLFTVHLRRKLSLCPHLFRRSRPQALRTRSWLRRHYMPGGLLYVRESFFLHLTIPLNTSLI